MTITIVIIVITCIVSLLAFNNHNAIDNLSMWPMMIDSRKQYYRLLTCGFVHADYLHLIFNMFTLYFFGRAVEQGFSPGFFLALYLSGIVMSSLPSYFKHRKTYGYRSIGASGGVSAVLFAAILLDPWVDIGLYGVIPIPGIVYAGLYIVFCIWAGRRSADNINHDAHLWGSVYGWAFALVVQPAVFKDFFVLLMHPHF